MLQIKQEQRASRIIIEGNTGFGKTTFSKRICYAWAKALIENEHEDGVSCLNQYFVVIPIILRLITKEKDLFSIIRNQFSFLTVPEICSLSKYIQENPKKVLILADGLDELCMQSSEFIKSFLQQRKHKEVVSIITSRTEGLNHDMSSSKYKRFEFCGFSEVKIKTYINKFFDHFFPNTDKGQKLIEHLMNEKKNLISLAKVPIRLEMICIVWAAYGKLGENLAELFYLFVLHLLQHLEVKCLEHGSNGSQVTEDELVRKYECNLALIAELANTWTGAGKLQMEFNEREVQKMLGPSYLEIRKIGLIVKSRPSCLRAQDMWSFPNRSIQEYLIAFSLNRSANFEKEKAFIENMNNIKNMQSSKLIFEFLCARFPSKANQLLTDLIQKAQDEETCDHMLSFLLDILANCNLSNICFLLPWYINTKRVPYTTQNKKILKTMIQKDKIYKQNLRKLVIHDAEMYHDILPGLKYIEDLEVTLNSNSCFGNVADAFHSMIAIKALKIEHTHGNEPKDEQLISTHAASVSDHSYLDLAENSEKQMEENLTKLLSRVNLQNLMSFSVVAHSAVNSLTKFVGNCPILEVMQVIDNKLGLRDTDLEMFVSEINKINSLKQLFVTTSDLHLPLSEQGLNCEVFLTVSALQKGSLIYCTDKLSRGNWVNTIHKLDLSGNDLKDTGGTLAKLLNILTAVVTICLENCNISKETIHQLSREMRADSTSSLSEINVNNNQLTGSGDYLGDILNKRQNLKVIKLGFCDLAPSDISSFTAKIPENNKITRMDLAEANLGCEEGIAFLQKIAAMEKLRLSGSADPFSCLGPVIRNEHLRKLVLLDLSNCNLSERSLCYLGSMLSFVRNLETLDLNSVSGPNPEAFNELLYNKNESIMHLNVYNEDIAIDYKDVSRKTCPWSKLKRLNIRMDIECRECLQAQWTGLHVYCDKDEKIWLD